jgi:CheY-like chemotaxis protein
MDKSTMATFRVLVVEDNHEVRRMVTASIKTLGSEIDVLDVPSAEEALVISASLPLDLVVLDFRLPGMTGLDMVSRLRKRRPETKIILVTGVEDVAIRRQVTEAHAEAYFFKPIEVDKFLEAVKGCLWLDQPALATHDAPPALADIPPAAQPDINSSLPAPDRPQASPPKLMPTLDERLTSLKQQLRAVSVLLVTATGQVLEVAGNPSQITSGSVLLSSLMHAFRSSVQVSQAMGRGTCTSLQYFAAQRHCLYVAPIGLSHALFIITAGYVEADKLSTVDRYIQLAVRDLDAILVNLAEEEQARQEQLQKLRDQLPTQVPVDQETRRSVDEMFARAGKTATRTGAEDFWDAANGVETPDKATGGDVLTFDQARDMGLAPGENKPA